MKIPRTSATKRGFTLMELMVAMAITTIIVTVLVSITSIALDTWNRSRAELRASRQAKSMIDTIARDFESLVTRKGNTNEWLSAIATTQTIGKKLASSNASELIFFTAATDRYNGNIGSATDDKGGDVSCVAYRLAYRDPIEKGGTSNFETFVLNRVLVNPDNTFKDLLGKTDSTKPASSLDKVFNGSLYAAELDKPENFVCENIYQFSITFHVQVTDTAKTPAVQVDVPVTIGQTNSAQSTKTFTIQGSGIKTELTPGTFTVDQIAAGRVTAMEVSVTVISDFGIDQLRNRTFTGSQQAEFLGKNSYEFSKLVQIPSM
ncbi:MAG: prepilin-type N-terminal cleavage/methylation domain-containing protein [Verrucomicrobiota bacterium]